MDALSLFKVAATTWLLSEHLSPLNLTASGVAEVIDLAGGVTYSFSCVPPIASVPIGKPSETHRIAQRAPIPGYILVKTQSLRFETDLPIPDPKWRYQFVFRKV